MVISEKKMQIVIDNYFKSECNVDTSIRDAFGKGFRIGVQKTANRPHGEWLEVEVLPEVYDIEGVKTWCSEMQCDQCGFRFTAIEGHIRQYNFCPNCGADMRGGDDE